MTVRLSTMATEGRVYLVDPSRLGLELPAYYLLHPATWERLSPEAQELLQGGPGVVAIRRAMRAAA